MKLKSLLPFVAMASFAIVLSAGCSGGSNHSDSSDEYKAELKKLNDVIRNASIYEQDRMQLVDSVKRQLSMSKTDAERTNQLLEISKMFLPMSADSSLKYSTMAVETATSMGDETTVIRAKISLLNSLSTSGIFTPAENLLNELSDMEMSRELKIDLWKAARQLYAYMFAYISNTNQYAHQYMEKSTAYDDSLLSVLPASDNAAQVIRGEQLVNERRYKEARLVLEHLLNTVPDDSRIYGMAAYQLAEVNRLTGNNNKYASLLAEAAISDVKRAVSEGLALPTLAHWLYEQGDLNDAFYYINYSLSEAMSGNARMRMVQIAESMPLIDEAYRHKINASRDEMAIYFLLTATLLVATGCLLFFLLRQIKKDREVQKKLKVTTAVQESYIGNFIGLISAYAEKLDSLAKLVGRKIAAGQTDDLLKMVKSGRFADVQNSNFDEIFDKAFLDLYPDFIFNFNKLLRPEEQVEVKTDGGLSTELRIYALVRLGVDESTRIAQILHYSLNTIYSYRNKMRNKAIDRENFDRDVMKIGR